VRFVVEKVALEQIFLRVIWFPPADHNFVIVSRSVVTAACGVRCAMALIKQHIIIPSIRGSVSELTLGWYRRKCKLGPKLLNSSLSSKELFTNYMLFSVLSVLAHISLRWGSSVSIVSDYSLDDLWSGVLSLIEVKDFSSAFGSRPALGPTQPPVQWVPGGGVLSPGLKRGRGVTLTTHPI
jgi:hypothetical protein